MPLSNPRGGTNRPIGEIGPHHLARTGTDNMQTLVLRTHIHIPLKQRRARNNASIGWILPLEFSICRVQRIKVIVIGSNVKRTLKQRGCAADLIFTFECPQWLDASSLYIPCLRTHAYQRP